MKPASFYSLTLQLDKDLGYPCGKDGLGPAEVGRQAQLFFLLRQKKLCNIEPHLFLWVHGRHFKSHIKRKSVLNSEAIVD